MPRHGELFILMMAQSLLLGKQLRRRYQLTVCYLI
jgi:hypothetical protein